MQVAANIAVGFVAMLHFVIAAVEMFLSRGSWFQEKLKTLGFDLDAAEVAPIVANAGLYNAFIAAGLTWSILAGRNSQALKFFFLSCVMIAGIYGAVTLSPRTFMFQTVPALIAALLVWMAGRQ